LNIETQGGDVRRDVAGSFLKSHQYAGLVEFCSAANKKFDTEHGFTATGSAADDGRAALWQTAAADLVKTWDSGRALF